MIAKRLLIAGRVQGVGYRDWTVARAQALGLDGWVRNMPDGRVEVVACGDTAAVEELARLCRRGPRAASVTDIEESIFDPPQEPGFTRA